MCCKLLFFRNALWATDFNPESTMVLSTQWREIFRTEHTSLWLLQQSIRKFWHKVCKFWVLTGFSVPHKLQDHLRWWFLIFLICNVTAKKERKTECKLKTQCRQSIKVGNLHPTSPDCSRWSLPTHLAPLFILNTARGGVLSVIKEKPWLSRFRIQWQDHQVSY